MNRWTVHVTDFGKIEKADIEVAPFTLFVGDNNSGKSYMMTLIYGLLYLDIFFQKFEIDTSSDIFPKCCEILDRMLEFDENEENIYVLNENDIANLQELLNQILSDNKEKFLRNLFNREMEIGQLWIEFPKDNHYEFEMENIDSFGDGEGSISLRGYEVKSQYMLGYAMEKERLKEENTYQFLLSYIMEYMIKKDFERKKVFFRKCKV